MFLFYCIAGGAAWQLQGIRLLAGARDYLKIIPYVGTAQMFLRNLLLDEKNELRNRNLHISGLWSGGKVDIEEGKVDIEEKKVDIQREKVDIESRLFEKAKEFSPKTEAHVHLLFEKFGFDEVFGRSAVAELLELQNSSASKLLSKLRQADIIVPVSGCGKGKYKFNR